MSVKKQAVSGVIWTFTQQFGNQIINFIISIFLARLLFPADFGLIGMISVFIGVGNALLNGGLTNSLIRSKDLNQDDYSTVFFYNLLTSVIIYIIIYFCSPLIARFYEEEILINLIRLYCLSFIVAAFMAVQQARLTKIMRFKVQTFISLPSLIVGGVAGISMAYMGYGVWSLVWSHLITQVLRSIQFWIYSGWTPSLIFDLDKFKEHFNFGYKLTLSSLVSKISKNSYSIIIGKYFLVSQVGYYNRAEVMRDLPVGNISLALNKVTYPLFSSFQDDNIKLKDVYRRIMRLVVYVVTPVLIISSVLAEPLFRFVLTEKWLPAVPYFQILCGAGIMYPLNMYNINLLLVKGRSDLTLRITVIQNILLIIFVFIGLQFGIFGLLYAQVVHSVVIFLINAYYTNKFIKYPAVNQLIDIFPILLLGFISGIVVFFIDREYVKLLDFYRILGGGIIGVFTYILLSSIFKISSWLELKNILLKSK